MNEMVNCDSSILIGNEGRFLQRINAHKHYVYIFISIVFSVLF